jgi:beta-glucosidase
MPKTLPSAVLLTLSVLATLTLAQTAPSPAIPPPDVGGPDAVWRDKSKSPDQRARDVLPRLTLQEKISLIHADGTFTTPGLPRFATGKLWMSDGPNGVREEIEATGWNPARATNDFSTAMPADIAMAASFDLDLGAAYGNVIGEEARTRGKHIMLGPGLNIMRSPLNGRNSEYLGEDPYLTSRMAVGFINALQSHGVAACAKHYALNNQETNRGTVNVHVDERTMREIYLPAFKAAVTEAHVLSIMTAYNRVNGEYCSENDFLLNTVLKKDWNFQGLVMTDWGGCHSTINAANHGLDLEMGSNVNAGAAAHDKDFLANPLLQIMQGENPAVPMSRIDDMVLRNLRVMFATGLFDPPAADAQAKPLMSPDHIEAARKIAEGGMVLLKNADQLLPLDPAKIKAIAVIGDNAQARFAHDGNSAAIKTAYEITPLEGIQKRAGNDSKVTFAQGYARAAGGRRGGAPATQNPQLLADAVTAAKAADVAIVVAGLYRGQDQEGADRPSFNLPPGQAELIQAVAKANPKTLVILTGGSPSLVDPWINDTAGLLMYWYGGTEGGNALARVIFGDVNPSGHLPCTWPKQIADSPAHNPNDPAIFPGVNGTPAGGGRGGNRGPLAADAGPQENYAEGILVGYRWFDARNINPQFPFGFGLSYTTFAMSDFSQIKAERAAGDKSIATFRLSIANTGTRAGSQVVQAYVTQANPSVVRPPQELKAFQKVSLNPGEKRAIDLSFDPSSFTHYDVAQHAWIADAGDYTILVGDSSRNLPLKATFHLPNAITIKEGP